MKSVELQPHLKHPSPTLPLSLSNTCELKGNFLQHPVLFVFFSDWEVFSIIWSQSIQPQIKLFGTTFTVIVDIKSNQGSATLWTLMAPPLSLSNALGPLMDICFRWTQSPYVGWMASARLACLLYNRISVIYELANCLCPDRFHDQANGLVGKVISCPISVLSIRET